MTNMNLTAIQQVAALMQDKEKVLFITGAGISADSGLPTYRGIGGLYDDNLTQDGVSIEEALSGPMFGVKPELTWKYLAQIERSCRGASYNMGHRVIADMQQHFTVTVLTQNVDGFHSQAGSSNVIDIHGDLHDLLCTQCSYEVHVLDYSELEIPPKCPECGNVLRPQVVLFGEMLPEDKLYQLFQEIQEGFDIVFSIGTTSVFPYIMQPVLIAKQRGIPTVEINPGNTNVSSLVDYKINAGAAETLMTLWHYFSGNNPLT